MEGPWCFLARLQVMFEGTTMLPGATHVWNSFALMKFRIHAWLALPRRRWTMDKILHHGLRVHVTCPFPDKAAETLDHISLPRLYAMMDVWIGVILKLRSRLPPPTMLWRSGGRRQSTLCMWQGGRSKTPLPCWCSTCYRWSIFNDRVFNDRHSMAPQTLDSIVKSIFTRPPREIPQDPFFLIVGAAFFSHSPSKSPIFAGLGHFSAWRSQDKSSILGVFGAPSEVKGQVG
jgi:hypothetical protein